MHGESPRLRLTDLLAALSVTTDLGHGQSPDDAMRACLIATRLAQAMSLPSSQISDVFYATLLRYVGCAAYTHEEAALFGGDEIDARAAAMTADLGDPRQALGFILFGVGRKAPPLKRVASVVAALPRAGAATKDLAAANCEVGAAMARRLGLTAGVQQALGQVYERWMGRGSRTSWAARICRSRCASSISRRSTWCAGAPDARSTLPSPRRSASTPRCSWRRSRTPTPGRPWWRPSPSHATGSRMAVSTPWPREVSLLDQDVAQCKPCAGLTDRITCLLRHGCKGLEQLPRQA
jgi:hypothetical protein